MTIEWNKYASGAFQFIWHVIHLSSPFTQCSISAFRLENKHVINTFAKFVENVSRNLWFARETTLNVLGMANKAIDTSGETWNIVERIRRMWINTSFESNGEIALRIYKVERNETEMARAAY